MTTCVVVMLNRCPRDIRRTITSHVLVVGGGAMLPGFCRRLGEEVRWLAKQRARHHDLAPVVAEDHLCIVNDTVCPRSIALWVGASIMAMLQVGVLSVMKEGRTECLIHPPPTTTVTTTATFTGNSRGGPISSQVKVRTESLHGNHPSIA